VNIISLQSAVTFGHVGNSAAVFPMQRLGHEVWPVYTVNFSNHTEYPSWCGPVIAPSDVAAVLDGISFAFAEVDVFLTGYLGSPELAQVVFDTVQRIKAANPDALYVCDPVIGNATVGSFVGEEIPDVFREQLIPLADAITPNHWELALLTGTDLLTVGDTVSAARNLCDRALVTSIGAYTDETLGMLDITPDAALLVETPRLGGNVVGAGDLATALFAAMQDQPGVDRLSHLAGTMFDIVSVVRERDLAELPLVECQDLIVDPCSRFTPTPV